MKFFYLNIIFCSVIFLSTFTYKQIFATTNQPINNEWKRVYLASYPRSGNHWVRYLVEEASYIATSSIYQDSGVGGGIPHLSQVFPWGGYCAPNGYEGNCRYPNQDENILLKSHYPPVYTAKYLPFAQQSYIHTIRIVRHPIDAIYSHYVYQNSVKIANNQPAFTQEALGQMIFNPKDIKDNVQRWRAFQTYWNAQPNVTTIRYEDLLNEPDKWLRTILNILEYEMTEEDIQRAVRKHSPTNSYLKHACHYSNEAIQFIEKELQDLLIQFKYTKTE